ncbi:MAG: hypothetical protein H7A23_19340 [Leptospiraceae bacterium]|nr:hypothetical protein [Leptospiraceae bacterium]
MEITEDTIVLEKIFDREQEVVEFFESSLEEHKSVQSFLSDIDDKLAKVQEQMDYVKLSFHPENDSSKNEKLMRLNAMLSKIVELKIKLILFEAKIIRDEITE